VMGILPVLILWDGQDACPNIVVWARCLHHKKFWDIFLFGNL
jgi:hypothetical protein